MEKYNSYKDSSIHFLGEIPKEWKTVRLKEVTNPLTGFPFKSSKYSDKGIKLARGINVKEGVFNWKDTKYWSNPEPFLNKYFLKNGDILIQMDGSKVGKNFCKVKSEDLPILLLQRVTRLRVKKELSSNFLYYTLASKGFFYWVTITKTDPMVPHIAPKDINNYIIPFPTLKEQTQIANYLDAKTTAIDKKVTLLEQKITHYKAYRKTLINETVTKGLWSSSEVEMNDSGIDWIGEIPEHWEVKRLKDISKDIGSGATPLTSNSENYNEGNIYWVNTGDLNNGIVINSKRKISEKALINYPNLKTYRKGTLIIAMYGATIGKLGILGIVATTNQACCRINLKEKYYSKFVFYWLLANKKNIISLSIGGTQPNISQTILSNLLLILPSSKKEQQQIADYLDTKTATIDKIVTNIETQITTLKELRKTLINEVVTGKVKVTA